MTSLPYWHMTRRLDAVTVRIEHERTEIVRVIFGAEPRRSVVATTCFERGVVEAPHAFAVLRPATHMHARRRAGRIFAVDRELDAKLETEWCRHRAIVGTAVF